MKNYKGREIKLNPPKKPTPLVKPKTYSTSKKKSK